MTSDNKYIGHETLEDWIHNVEVNVQLEEEFIQSLIDTHEYQIEEKFYKDIFRSKHHEVNEREKMLNWYKQLLGFLTELKQLREEKKNDS